MSIATIVLASYAVRGVDGSIDHEATGDKFASDLVAYEAERETEMEVISDAVHAVFDEYKGTRINMPALVTFSLQKLNVQPSNYNALGARVLEFVRTNSGEGDAFTIGKGKGGGCARVCDLPAKPATDTQ